MSQWHLGEGEVSLVLDGDFAWEAITELKAALVAGLQASTGGPEKPMIIDGTKLSTFDVATVQLLCLMVKDHPQVSLRLIPHALGQRINDLAHHLGLPQPCIQEPEP